MLTPPACSACLRRQVPVPGHPRVPGKPVRRARVSGARPFVVEVPARRFHPALRAGEVDAPVVDAQRGRVALQLAQKGRQGRHGPRANRLVGHSVMRHKAWHRARESLAESRHAPLQGQASGQVSFLGKRGLVGRLARRRLAAGRDLSGEGSCVAAIGRQTKPRTARPDEEEEPGGRYGATGQRGPRTSGCACPDDCADA